MENVIRIVFWKAQVPYCFAHFSRVFSINNLFECIVAIAQ